jgi:hypothetical protein
LAVVDVDSCCCSLKLEVTKKYEEKKDMNVYEQQQRGH